MAKTKQTRNKDPEQVRQDVGLGLSLFGGALSGVGGALAAGRTPPAEEESTSTDLAMYAIPAALVVGGGVAIWKLTR